MIYPQDHQTVIDVATESEFDTDAVRQCLAMIGAPDTLWNFPVVIRRLRITLRWLPQYIVRNHREIVDRLRQFAEWAHRHGDTIGYRLATENSKHRKPIKSLVGKCATKHPVYTALNAEHESAACTESWMRLLAIVVLAHAITCQRNANDEQYAALASQSFVEAGLALRRLSHKDLSRMDQQLPFDNPERVTVALTKLIHSTHKESGDAGRLARCVGPVLYGLERPLKEPNHGGGGGSAWVHGFMGNYYPSFDFIGPGRSGGEEWLLFGPVPDADEDPDSDSSGSRVLQADALALQLFWAVAGNEEDLAGYIASIRAEPRGDRPGRRYSWAGEAVTDREAIQLARALRREVAMLLDRDRFDDRDRMRTRRLIAFNLMLWTGLPLHRVRNCQFAHKDGGQSGVMLLIADDPRLVVPIEGPEYRRAQTYQETETRLVRDYVILPDAAGVFGLLVDLARRAGLKTGQKILTGPTTHVERELAQLLSIHGLPSRITPRRITNWIRQRMRRQIDDVSVALLLLDRSERDVLIKTKTHYHAPVLGQLVESWSQAVTALGDLDRRAD